MCAQYQSGGLSEHSLLDERGGICSAGEYGRVRIADINNCGDDECMDLSPLVHYKHLEYLRVYGWGEVDGNAQLDLAPVIDLQCLRYVHLESCHVQSLEPLVHLPALTHLILDWSRIHSLVPISNHPSLTTLSLYKACPLNDAERILSVMRSLPQIKRVCVCKLGVPDVISAGLTTWLDTTLEHFPGNDMDTLQEYLSV